MLLAAIGIYGLMAGTVAGRRRELGIRMALGAQGADVVWLMLRIGLRFDPGFGIATWPRVASLFRTDRGVMGDLVFGIEPTDATTFLVTTVVLGGVASVACYLPARRAARMEPVRALRID